MKIGVIGGGSAGLAIAHYTTTDSENDAIVVTRTQQQADVINSEGVIYSPDNTNWSRSGNIFAATSYDDLKNCDLVFVVLKQFDIPGIINNLRGLRFDQKTDLIFVSNGIGVGEYVLSQIGKEQLIKNNINLCSGSTMVASKRKAANKVFCSSVSKSASYGPIEGFDVPKDFEKKIGEFTIRIYESATIAELLKAQYAVLHNATSAIFNMNLFDLYQTDYTKHFIKLLHDEFVKVVAAIGIQESFDSFELIVKDFGWNKYYLSTWHDYQNNLPTEIPYINGRFVELAEKYEVKAPMNKSVTRFFEVYEQKLVK